jgi:hypothetical protein
MNNLAALAAVGPAFADRWSLAPDLPVRHDDRRVVVAVATADGAHVDRDFEDAEAFLLYEKDGCRTGFIGRQPCPLRSGPGGAMNRARLLADCDLVLCSSVSDSSRRRLLEMGIDCSLAFAGAMITDVVSALRRDPAS